MTNLRNRRHSALVAAALFAASLLSLSVRLLMPGGGAPAGVAGAPHPPPGALAAPRPPPAAPEPPRRLLEALRDGDIVCRLGDRLWSQWFMDVSVSDRRYSHLGIARVSGGRATVIHSEGTAPPGEGAVREEGLEDFLKVAKAAGVYRAKGVEGALVSRTAAEYLGVPFDWRFDLDDGSKLYCTELLYVVFRRVAPGLELATVGVGARGRKVIPLEAVSNSDHFEEVCCIAAENR